MGVQRVNPCGVLSVNLLRTRLFSWCAPTIRVAVWAVAMLLSAGMSGARAQSVAFPQMVEDAWAIDPTRRELDTNYHSASARADAARSWFAGGPTVTGQYFDDHAIGSNEGYTTYQGGVSVPLWLPGQRTATVKAARAEAVSVQERIHVARMAIAMRVLDLSAASIMAQRRLGIAKALRETLTRIGQSVGHGVRAGEVAQSDQQAVTAELDNAANECILAEEQVTTTTSALQIVVGRPGVPDILSYDDPALARTRLTSTQIIEENDPRVRAARQAVRAAQEGMQLARSSFMPNPEVGVGAIHEKQYGSPWDNRVGVTVSVPLPSDVRNVPIITDAQNKLAAAVTQEMEARRNVRQELAQVFARVGAARNAARNAMSAADTMNSRANAMTRSWQAGETSLIEALRARMAAYNALQLRNQADIAWHAAVIRTLIAAGEFQ